MTPETPENICTDAAPMPKDAPGPWVHPLAVCVYDGYDYDRYWCPVCGKRFTVTVPQ